MTTQLDSPADTNGHSFEYAEGAATSGNTEPEPQKPEADVDAATTDEVEAARAEVRRKWEIKAATAEEEAAGRARLSDAEINGIEAKERVTLRKVLRTKRKMEDPNAHLVHTYQRQRIVSWVLSLGMAGGVVFTSYGVAHALDGPEPAWIYYLAEPMISVPLLVIVFMQIDAAKAGRLGPLKPFYRKPGRRIGSPTLTGVIEMFFLALSVAVNSWPAITADPFDLEQLVTRMFAPVMIVVFVLLRLVASELYSGIIRETRLDDTGDGESARAKARSALDKAVDVMRAQEGTNPLPTSEDGLPSVSAITRRFRGEKVTSQIARDALERFEQERREVQQ